MNRDIICMITEQKKGENEKKKENEPYIHTYI